MQYSKIFLVGLTSLSLLLTACGGSENIYFKPGSDNNSGSDGSGSGNNDNGTGGNTGGEGTDNGESGGGSGEGDSEDGGSDNGGNPPETSELCTLPADNITDDIYAGLGDKNAYQLGSPNNYIEESTGVDLSGTWALVSKTTEQQQDYSRIIYQKSFFIIKKDSGKYLAANCRAAHSEPVYKEQWFNKTDNPVPANCQDFPLINGQPSGLAPDACLAKNNDGKVIGLLNIHNPEAVTKKLVQTGSQSAPWTGFITATAPKSNGEDFIELPFTDPTDLRSDKTSLSFKIEGQTYSKLSLSTAVTSSSKTAESHFEAVKVSNKTAKLGTSSMQYDTDGAVTHTDNNSDIYCITQQFVIERQSCATPNTVPSFTITTNTHQHGVAAMKAETLPNNLHLAISEYEQAGEYKTVRTGSLDMPEKDWYTEAKLDSSTEFKPDQIDFKLTLKNTTVPDSSTPENPVPPIAKSAVYEFHATIPDTTTP